MKYNFINKVKKEKFRIIIISLITVVLIIFAAKTYSEGNIKEDQTLDEFISHLNSQIPILMKDYEIPGLNIALIKEGKLSWTKAYGYANLSQNRNLTPTVLVIILNGFLMEINQFHMGGRELAGCHTFSLSLKQGME